MLTIEDAVSEICKLYGHAPHEGPQALTVILAELISTWWSSEAAKEYEELHGLLESYLCCESASPEVEENYFKLVRWFESHKRPDGTTPPKATPIPPDYSEMVQLDGEKPCDCCGGKRLVTSGCGWRPCPACSPYDLDKTPAPTSD